MIIHGQFGFNFPSGSWIKLWKVSRIKMNKQWIDISIIWVFFLTCFNLFNLDGYFKSNILLFFLTIYTFFFFKSNRLFFLKFNRLSLNINILSFLKILKIFILTFLNMFTPFFKKQFIVNWYFSNHSGSLFVFLIICMFSNITFP